MDYPILELVFGIVGDRFIPHYSWDKPVIAYSYAFISLLHVTCTQKYMAGDFDCFFIAAEAVFYWLPAPQAQT
jgi:hypothetical protein